MTLFEGQNQCRKRFRGVSRRKGPGSNLGEHDAVVLVEVLTKLARYRTLSPSVWLQVTWDDAAEVVLACRRSIRTPCTRATTSTTPRTRSTGTTRTAAGSSTCRR
eukprot:1970286-Rhodomonas_salina.1